MSKFVSVYIEIAKHSHEKFEFDKKQNQLLLDRNLNYPYFYPYSYGFIPNTLGSDGDELDCLVISNTNYPPNTFLQAYIIGALVMEDEKGMDEKILVIPANEYNSDCAIQDINDVQESILKNLEWIFSGYKSHEKMKWSRVDGFVNRQKSLELFYTSVSRFLDCHDHSPV